MRAYRFVLSVGLLTMVTAACAQGVTNSRRSGDDDEGDGGNVPEGCGDGVLVKADGEQCDGDDFGGVTCQTLGFTGGTIVCSAECIIDGSGCGDQTCGNGTREGSEECDGTDLGGMDCMTTGMGSGTLTCDPTCMYSGCSSNFSDDFETGALGAGWTPTGSPPWLVTGNLPHGGSFTAQNGDITASQQSGMSRSLNFTAAGSVTYWHRESSEPCCDFLKVYVDGLEQGSFSGETTWQQATVPMTQGTHSLEFRYTKDGSVDAGSDTVWIDDVVATGGT